ncbi:AraC family transcriptional regulator [Chryseolinea sp. H1M3-3]|uniref:helix-turn-helix domain-containing protein n=1 Tax=Chryseolinea sp. H1M3-3 TaxID=3034144 RepID=UPI0023EC953E|nr:AraC family transcriptional regulator [Chryseolinea sp. H1M3-3]
MIHLSLDQVSKNDVLETVPIVDKGVTWNGLTIKQKSSGSISLSKCLLSKHTLQINLGGPIYLSWKSNGDWRSGRCTPGNIISLNSCGDTVEIEYHGSCTILEIAFDPLYVEKLLETDNIKFREEHNIYDSLLADISSVFTTAPLGLMTEKLYIESLGVMCGIHLAANYTTRDKRIFAPKGKLSSCQLKTIIEYVRTHLHGVITLEQLAESANLSIFHFSRLFKNTIGLSPYQFVLKMKIEYAKTLIRHRQPIGDIAFSLGFTDSAHFCNAFKKVTGHSPLKLHHV